MLNTNQIAAQVMRSVTNTSTPATASLTKKLAQKGEVSRRFINDHFVSSLHCKASVTIGKDNIFKILNNQSRELIS